MDAYWGWWRRLEDHPDQGLSNASWKMQVENINDLTIASRR